MTISIACPYCHTDSRILPVYTGGAQTNLGYSLYHCGGCDLPFITVLEMVPKVTVHRVEGFEPQIKLEYEASIPTMEEVEQDFKEHTRIECGHVDTDDSETFYQVGDCDLYEMCCHTITAINREEEAAKLSDAGTLTGTQPDPPQFLCDLLLFFGCGFG